MNDRCVQKGDFLGRSELVRLKETHAQLTRRCVHLILREHDTERDPFPHGDEPIYRCAVFVSSAYIFCLPRSLLFYIAITDNLSLQIEYQMTLLLLP